MSRNTPEPNLPVAEADALIFWYKNYRGEEGYRRVIPISVRFGVSEWHGEKPQWLMLGIDTEKSVEREFAMSDMKNFVGPAVIRATPIPDSSAGEREVVQQSIATKQSTDATGDSASETACWKHIGDIPPKPMMVEFFCRDLMYHDYKTGEPISPIIEPWRDCRFDLGYFDGSDFRHLGTGHLTFENYSDYPATQFPTHYRELVPPAVAETRRTAPDDTSLLHGISSDPPSSAGERMREALELSRLDFHNGLDKLDRALALQGPSGKTGDGGAA